VFDRFNHIDEVINTGGWMKNVPGNMLPRLNHTVSAGPVLHNQNDDLVSAIIQGYTKVDKPGPYTFSGQHNDGAQLWIGDSMPYVSSFGAPVLFSPNLEVGADQAGWHPVRIIYYEKKGATALELY
jgi:hypothetical protein